MGVVCCFIAVLVYLQINTIVDEHIKYAGSNIDNSVWEAIHEEGEMKVFRREMEEDGMIVDPLKAVHSVKVCLQCPVESFRCW